jgi:L-alanine-DL-glutamate epimerase-like enolase superfamily enzyme
MGYPAFKIHSWGEGSKRLDREIGVILKVREAVGPGIALMLDPACELTTWADAWQIGRACDDARFFWIEDPYRDGGISQFGHRKLRQLIKTPILQTEHVRTLEPHVDFAIAEATDFLRGDVGYDGVTGVMKIAHAAEGLGIDIEMHGAGPLQRHLMTSVRNTNYYEMGLLNPKNKGTGAPIYKGYHDGLDAIDKNGCVYAPTGPGIGVELDWDFINKHKVSHATYK